MISIRITFIQKLFLQVGHLVQNLIGQQSCKPSFFLKKGIWAENLTFYIFNVAHLYSLYTG
jgi:hypothetical protein